MKNKSFSKISVSIATALFALCFATAAFAQETPAPESGQKSITFKVMTINIRHSKDFWEERFPLIADEIVRLKPDIIGLQEVQIDIKQSKTLLKLIEELSGADSLKYEKYEHLKTGYEMHGGEGVAIFSRYPIIKKSFADLKHGRPVVFSRIAVADGLTIDFYNTHLHNAGPEVTFPQAQKLVEFEKKNDAGFITFLTGDMNSYDDYPSVRHFVENGFVDTYYAVHGEETPILGNTCPVIMSKENVQQNFEKRIDFVFMKTPPGTEAQVKIVESDVYFKNLDERGLYPSDHLGVMTTFEIKY